MKTKIVYIVTSTPEDIYLEQTLLSVFSLKRVMPSAFVELVVDENTNSSLVGKRSEIFKYVNKINVVTVPSIYSKAQVSRFIKTNVRKYIDGDFLFIDSDTIITARLDEIDDFGSDIGMVRDIHVPLKRNIDKSQVLKRLIRVGWNGDEEIDYFNSGVIFARESPKAHDFFQAWHDKWKETNRKGFHYDQPSLAVVNAEQSSKIKELDGIWNCQIMNGGLPYLHRAKIIHYFASSSERRKKVDKAYLFLNNQIFEKMKELGFVYPELISLIDNAKGAFVISNKVVTGNELQLTRNSLSALYYRHPSIYKSLNLFARGILKVSGACNRLNKQLLKRN